MKENLQFLWIMLVFIAVQLLYTPVICGASEKMLTPENFSTRVTLQPSITKLIEEDDVETALKMLNIMHSKMAEKGWILFDLLEFIDDEDFEGFFVTYIKDRTTSF